MDDIPINEMQPCMHKAAPVAARVGPGETSLAQKKTIMLSDMPTPCGLVEDRGIGCRAATAAMSCCQLLFISVSFKVFCRVPIVLESFLRISERLSIPLPQSAYDKDEDNGLTLLVFDVTTVEFFLLFTFAILHVRFFYFLYWELGA